MLRLSGDLDTGTSGDAQDKIVQMIDDGASNMLINLKDVGFVSSAGCVFCWLLQRKWSASTARCESLISMRRCTTS